MFARRSTRPAPDLAEMRGEWRSEATWPPERLGEQVLRPEGEGTDTIHVRGDVGRTAWISCAGKLPWGLPGRPARRRRALAHLRLGAARRRARRDGAPARAAHRHLAGSRRVRLGQALRRLSRRHVRARRPRAAQPDAPATATTLPSRSSPASRPRSRSSSRRRRGSSSRAIACGSRSPAPTGRTSGRRRAVRRCRSIARASSSCCRCSTGRSPLPAPVLPPTTGKDTHAPESDDEQPPTVWRLEDDQIGARVALRHGIRLELRGTVRGAGRGAVRGHDRRLEGRSCAARGRGAAPCTASPGPRPTCAPRRRSTLRSDAEAYHVVITLIAEELGPEAGETAFYRERRFERSFTRRLA